MKNYFHNDVDNENIEIANKLFEDSNQFSDDNISKPALDNIINKETSSKKTFKKSQIFAIASAIAACILLMFVIDFSPRTGSSSGLTIGPEDNHYNSVTFADEYEQIKEKLVELANNEFSANYAKQEGLLVSEDTVGGWVDGYGNASIKSSGNTDTSINDTNINFALSDTTSKTDYYDTNEQTENVHEADIVKTNGEYIFTVDGYNKKKIHVTRVNGFDMKTVSTIKISGLLSDVSVNTEIIEFYLCNDYLIAIVSDLYSIDNKTFSLVFDISDTKDINLISSHCQDGNYVSSRMQGNYLYTITNDSSNNEIFYNDGKVYSLKEPVEYIPEVDGCIISPNSIYIPEEINSSNFTIITGLDVTSSKDFTTIKSILGGSDNIYVSQSNIYILNNTYIEEDISYTNLGKKAAKEHTVYDNYEYPLSEDHRNQLKYYVHNYDKKTTFNDITSCLDTEIYERTVATEIIKYNYEDGNIEYVASNIIPGVAENNLNFDEYGDFLRCVTTENSTSRFTTYINCYDKKKNKICKFIFEDDILESKDDTNNVIVLSKELEPVAIIDGLAEGESIYSARYFGKYGYFVTYEETDPLFSVDFSDINNPKIIGELKMPGVSEYLHFYNDNILLGFGYEDDDDFSTNLKLEMYDVSTGIAEKKNKKILKDYSYSKALLDYKAIMVDGEKNLIGFAAETNDDWMKLEQHYVVYTYDDNDFKELLKIKIPKYAYEVRGFYIGDYLYVVCPEYSIRAVNMKTYNEDQKVEKLKLK